MLPGHLHDAKIRPIGALAHEFGINRYEFLGGEAGAQGLQISGGGDQGRWREFSAQRTGHVPFYTPDGEDGKGCLWCRATLMRCRLRQNPAFLIAIALSKTRQDSTKPLAPSSCYASASAPTSMPARAKAIKHLL